MEATFDLLYGRPAYHFVATCKAKGRHYTQEQILAVADRPGVEYKITFKTRSGRFATLRPLFRKLVASWRWTAYGEPGTGDY